METNESEQEPINNTNRAMIQTDGDQLPENSFLPQINESPNQSDLSSQSDSENNKSKKRNKQKTALLGDKNHQKKITEEIGFNKQENEDNGELLSSKMIISKPRLAIQNSTRVQNNGLSAMNAIKQIRGSGQLKNPIIDQMKDIKVVKNDYGKSRVTIIGNQQNSSFQKQNTNSYPSPPKKSIVTPSYYGIIRNLRISFNVKKFTNILKKFSSQLNFKNLNLKQFLMINDYAACFNYYQKNLYIKQKRLSYIDKYLSKSQDQLLLEENNTEIESKQCFILNPSSYMKLMFDFVLLFFLVVQFIIIPLNIGFELKDEHFDIWLSISLILFGTDIIVVKPNTAIYKNGKYISNRKDIIIEYWSGKFVFDVIMLCSLFIGRFINFNWIQVIFLLRLDDAIKIYHDLEDYFQFRDRLAAWSRLLQLISFVLLAAHFIACAWHKFALYEYDQGVSPDNIWLGDKIYDGWKTRYIYSLYWTIITMITVGYGDICRILLIPLYKKLYYICR